MYFHYIYLLSIIKLMPYVHIQCVYITHIESCPHVPRLLITPRTPARRPLTMMVFCILGTLVDLIMTGKVVCHLYKVYVGGGGCTWGRGVHVGY